MYTSDQHFDQDRIRYDQTCCFYSEHFKSHAPLFSLIINFIFSLLMKFCQHVCVGPQFNILAENVQARHW